MLELQKKLKPIKKEDDNPYFKSKYFDINTLLAAIKPDLDSVGLVLSQPLSFKDGLAGIKTLLVDTETGEMIDEFTPLPLTADAQKMGSAITYLRRYAIQSLLALEAIDDDGNSASGKQTPPKPISEPTEHRYEPELTAEELNEIDKAFGVQPTPKNELPFKTKIVGEICHDCGKGKYVKNPNTGSIFCAEKCWTKK